MLVKKLVKKAQEEMVGFALIIVIVAVLALILLIIAGRKPVAPDESRELANFLNSIAQYTTECSESGSPYSVKEVIRACVGEAQCQNGKAACKVMNATLQPLLDAAFPIDGKVKSYYFTLSYNHTEIKRILALGNMSCTGAKKGAEFFYPSNPGTLTMALEGCYG